MIELLAVILDTSDPTERSSSGMVDDEIPMLPEGSEGALLRSEVAFDPSRLAFATALNRATTEGARRVNVSVTALSLLHLPPFVARRLSWRSKSTFTAFDEGILLSILRLFSSFFKTNSFFSRFFSSSCFIVAVFRPAKIGT